MLDGNRTQRKKDWMEFYRDFELVIEFIRRTELDTLEGKNGLETKLIN